MLTQEVRSLQRGLAILEYFNVWNRGTVTDIAAAFRLPRGTAYRLVETLRRNGYLTKGAERGQYLLSPLVAELSSAFSAEPWIAETRATLDHVAAVIGWPVSLVSCADGVLSVRARSASRRTGLRATAFGSSPICKRPTRPT